MHAATCLAALLAWSSSAEAADVYDEANRPQFHFSAKKGWLNDPNGLVYFEGQYHLFYQHNPFGEQWGNMTWGHATSTDLVHWDERTPALAADPTGVKFSGTAVIDTNNSLGLQQGDTPTMALFYTSVGGFDQRLAYSNDAGRSFRYYDGNPVLPSQSGADDRDPQVFWHEDSNKWVQALWVAPHNGTPGGFDLFGSENLTDWTYLSSNPGFFECPDMFELPVDGDANDTRWVMYGADGRYQLGDFDGTSFTNQTPGGSGTLIQDYGANFYAPQTWHDVPSDDGRRLQVTWMRGPAYSDVPYNQQMGFPVELSLRTTSDGVRMVRNPVEEISLLHQTEHAVSNVDFGPNDDPLGELSGDLFHIETLIELGTASTVGFNIRGHEVVYDVASKTLTALGRSAPLEPVRGRINLELLVDRTSIELFGGNGLVSMTSSFAPSSGNTGIDLFATGGQARVVNLSAYELASAWPDQQPTPASGLIGHWKFDDPSLTATFVDDAGSDYGLANSGAVSGLAGVAGGAARFDNPGDHAYIPNQEALNPDSFTASFWLRPGADGQSYILGKTSETGGTWGVDRLEDGRIEFFVTTANDKTDRIQSATVLDENAWSHAAASYDAESGRLEFFVNGLFAGASEGVVAGRPDYDDSPLMVGDRLIGGASGTGSVNGAFDDLQLYGSRLSPGQIGYLFQNPGVSIDPATFEVAHLKLVVDSATGAATLVGLDESTVLKGYTIYSLGSQLDVNGWSSLQSQSSPGWEEANPSAGYLSELNPLGSLTVASGQSVALGAPVTPSLVVEFGTPLSNVDLGFQYTTADQQVINGVVEFVGESLANNLLLEVDPATGIARVSNDSYQTVHLRGYSILSESGSLSPGDGDWSSLSDQGVEGVDEANASPEHLSEFAAFVEGGITLAPGQAYELGDILSGDADDLRLEFVLERALDQPGDYNRDGVVDAADYVVWRDREGSSLVLPNETATPGMVTEEDYDVWADNYGSRAPTEFVLMSGVVRYVNLGAATGVPEPSSASLLVGVLLAATRRRNHRG